MTLFNSHRTTNNQPTVLTGVFCLSKYRHGHSRSAQSSIRTPYQERSVIFLAELSPGHIQHNDM